MQEDGDIILSKSRQLTGFQHLQHVKDVIHEALQADAAILNAEFALSESALL